MALGKKTGGRQKGSKNKKKSITDEIENLLQGYSAEAIVIAFEKARKRNNAVPKKLLPIIDHLCGKAYKDTTLALALLKKITADKQTKALLELPKDTKWAKSTPDEIVRKMDKLTCEGDKE